MSVAVAVRSANPEPSHLTVGEVADLSGTSTSAVRFYERQGLFASVRTSGNQRRYAEVVPCLVRVARVAQRVGLTVREIRDLFASVSDESTVEDWFEMNARLVAEAERRIAALRDALDDLASRRPLCELPHDGRTVRAGQNSRG